MNDFVLCFVIIAQAMIADQESIIDNLTPLLKIIRDRQSLYFEAFAFINKNIESSSNDFDQIYIFNKFLNATKITQTELVKAENLFLKSITVGDEESTQSRRIQSSSKQMMRLSVRVLEMLETSVERVRNSLFSENGKLAVEFSRLKKALHKIVKKDHIQLHDFASAIINFSKNKYKKQVVKLQTYLHKLQTGDQVSLRDMYAFREGSDGSVSPQEKIQKHKLSMQKKFKNEQSGHSSSESPHKRASVKKVAPTRQKKTLNLKATKKDQGEKTKEKPQKAATAEKLLKFYAMLQLQKKEFLEDYVFDKLEEEEQKRRLLNNLIQKNKFNQEQIKQHRKKCHHFNPATHVIPNPSSDQNPSVYRNESSSSKISLKTSFIISRRKPSYTFQSPGTDKSDVEIIKNQLPFSRTIKNITKKTARSNTPRPNNNTSKNKSRKLFVVKQPMMFEDEGIPKAPLQQNHWMKTPLTGKEKTKKNEQLRLKKRNNPLPLDSSCLPESFNFTHYPL